MRKRARRLTREGQRDSIVVAFPGLNATAVSKHRGGLSHVPRAVRGHEVAFQRWFDDELKTLGSWRVSGGRELAARRALRA